MEGPQPAWPSSPPKPQDFAVTSKAWRLLVRRRRRYAPDMPRLPRFVRDRPANQIAITDRDRHVIRLVHQHRFLRSSQIFAFLGGSAQQILRRLQLLYHHGYVERPRCQLDYYYHGGSRQIVYGLADKGAAVLRQEGIPVREARISEKNRSVGRVHLEHVLMVSDVMIAFEIACRQSGVRLLSESALGTTKPFRWRASVSSTVTLGIIPDRVFGVEYREPSSALRRAFFFLEADRGTMPVARANLAQTSVYRKLLTYEATWTQGIHRARFGFNRFRVVTVTSSSSRMEALVSASSRLERGHGLFLFADRTILAKPSDLLSAVWRSANGQPASLLD